MKGKIVSINVSNKTGIRKTPVEEVSIIENKGIAGDAHASSNWHRQVSLLAIESIQKMQKAGLDVKPGDFAENITTEGLDLINLPIGTRMKLGNEVLGEVSQIGKKCHTKCAIYEQAGDCVMPKEGIFIKIMKGGIIKTGDEIEIMQRRPIEDYLTNIEERPY
ncbi:MAG: MOSC domain-containing protein [Thermodesulfovibrionales bacterium]|nr:MOSC domain-containing protein [Thermodesulfovibrionales bacterium]